MPKTEIARIVLNTHELDKIREAIIETAPEMCERPTCCDGCYTQTLCNEFMRATERIEEYLNANQEMNILMVISTKAEDLPISVNGSEFKFSIK